MPRRAWPCCDERGPEFRQAPQVDRAVRGAQARPGDLPALDELTPRELEVFKLLATGMTNAEIAGRLIVGETTVKTHVARILMKLGLRDRVQAVVAAYESGVVRPGAGSSLSPRA